MIHRATSPAVEELKAALIASCLPYRRVDQMVERLLQAQDDATLASTQSRTLGSEVRVFDLDRLRAAEGLHAACPSDDAEAA